MTTIPVEDGQGAAETTDHQSEANQGDGERDPEESGYSGPFAGLRQRRMLLYSYTPSNEHGNQNSQEMSAGTASKAYSDVAEADEEDEGFDSGNEASVQMEWDDDRQQEENSLASPKVEAGTLQSIEVESGAFNIISRLEALEEGRDIVSWAREVSLMAVSN